MNGAPVLGYVFPTTLRSSDIAMRVVISAFRMNHQKDFKFDAVSCYMQMSHGDDHHKAGSEPILGVYNVYGVLSGNLSLPYVVKK